MFFFLGIYGSLAVAYLLLMLLRSIFFVYFALVCASVVQKTIFRRIIRAPMSFFDSTPLGRIINRFAQDQDRVDDTLPETFMTCLHFNIGTLFTIAVICFSLPWFVLPMIPILIITVVQMKYFLRSSREIKRLESISISPIFAHVSSTLQGLTSIKAYGVEERFQNEILTKIDTNNALLFAFESISRWLSLRLDVIGSFMVGIISALLVILKDSISPAIAGLALSYSLQMIASLQWSANKYAEAENQMTSVERLLYYTTEVPQEAPSEIPERKPDPEWPRQGVIEFKNVVMKYRPEDEPVIKNLSFSIKDKEKIGIVGRTGAGKSTLTLALFRLLEAYQGKIIIDGIDILQIGLDDLRSKLAIIPQDPILFLGSVRSNLDPFNNNTDEQVWDALEKVHMKTSILELPNQLLTEVEEAGKNFSLGQRQLICIARALLRNSKILVLDEATAALDMQSDYLIQKTIKESFSGCTVLTIAHRLHTIIDSDRIMVLEKGQLAEFDTPHALLSDENSLFTKLVDQTDKQTASHLKAQALSNSNLRAT